jgi:hypothetical protein
MELLLRRGLYHDSIHITRMVLVFMFQSPAEAHWFIDPDFYAHVLSNSMLPALYRGVSGQVFPQMVYSFWKNRFEGQLSQDIVVRMLEEFWPRNVVNSV